VTGRRSDRYETSESQAQPAIAFLAAQVIANKRTAIERNAKGRPVREVWDKRVLHLDTSGMRALLGLRASKLRR
jgi:hypothetical protein